MTPNYSVNKFFSKEQEESLAEYVLTCSKMFYGLSMVEVRKLAYQMAARNDIKDPDKWKQLKIAGIEWIAGFMHRHRNLSLRLAEGLVWFGLAVYRVLLHSMRIKFQSFLTIYIRSLTKIQHSQMAVEFLI